MGTDLVGRTLRAGSLEVTLDGSDLRHVTWHGVEVVRRLYVAVRPADWSTVPPLVTRTQVREEAAAFHVELACQHRGHGIVYRWTGTITGTPEGLLSYRMEGCAEAGFRYARIGLCVLHPPSVAGSRYVAEDRGGVVEVGSLPALVTPQLVRGGALRPAVGPFRRLELGTVDAAVRMELDGDDFEMEDQRNWTDASFKTYSTPLGAGPPAPAAAGDRFTQSVRISLPSRAVTRGAPPAEPAGKEPVRAEPARIAATERAGVRVGAVGVVADHLGAPHSAAGRRLLREAGLAHLRIDVRPDDTEDLVDARLDLVRASGAPVEVALYAPADGGWIPTTRLLEKLTGLAVSRLLVLPDSPQAGTPTELTSPRAVAAVRTEVAGLLPGVPVGGGSDAHFCEVNRWRPARGVFDVVAFPVVAQEHAQDDRSMVEAHQVLGDVMATCRSFVGDVPVAVGPVTLRRRVPAVPPGTGDDPAADPRQHTPFAAAWLLGEIGALFSAGADAVTAFTTSGGRGVIADDGPVPVPAPSLAVLAALAARRGEEVLRVRGIDPMRTAAFASTDGRVTRLLVADLTGRGQSVLLPPAVRSPAVLEDGVWTQRPVTIPVLELPPHGIARVEWPAAAPSSGGAERRPERDGEEDGR